ncbi:hypothetical protein KP509_29G035800 [Ceratopteris richardii]|nr:hypothetical protein KP509_29G035800 [Ceratopteris richardii]
MDGKEIFLDIVQQNKIDLPSLVEFLAHILKEASHFYLESDIHVSRKLPTTTGPSGIPVIDVMGYTLELLKVISGFDCWDSKLDSMSFRKSIIDGLLQNHVIELCLELLKRLGPPELIYRAMQHSNPGEGSVQTAIDHAEHFLRMTRVTLPYRGFRRDLVSIIGNAAYGSQTVQDAVRSQGGLFLLLQQCVVDEENPFLKEWGLWAVRNLVHDNTENAKEIGTLQLRGSFTPVELAEKGYKVEMDVALGRPKLINLSPGC